MSPAPGCNDRRNAPLDTEARPSASLPKSEALFDVRGVKQVRRTAAMRTQRRALV